MAQRVAPRASKSDDWDDDCSICFGSGDDGDESRERLLVCECCPHVAHKSCLPKRLNDLPSGAYWTCPDCVGGFDTLTHDARCLKCEGHNNLITDIEQAIGVVEHDAAAAGASMEPASWARACLASTAEDLVRYHNHKIRDANMTKFQPWCVERVSLDPTSWCDLYDF